MIRILAVGRVRGAPAACVLAAAIVVVAGFGARPAGLLQAAQQAGEAGTAQGSGTERQAAEAGAEQPGGELEPEAPAGTFKAPAGLVLSYIKSGGAADFERVMGKLGAALAGSDDEQHRQLASGWRIFRAREPGPDGEVLYVWLIDPVLAGTDYAVPELLGAALPDESQALFDAFSETFGSGQAVINLEPVDIGPDPPQ